MNRSSLFRLFFLFLIIISFTPSLLAQLPPGFVQVQLADGLDPTAMTVAPDGRVFISEKSGRIRVWKKGVLLPEPFLSIKVDNYNERGLGGMVLDPDFERNHYVYVFYTVFGVNFNRISRFIANGDYVLPESETIILDLDRLGGTIHNGGAMAFGPDGKLYIAVGDGANSANSQNFNNLLGKVLRINPDGSIPTDNPFFTQAAGRNRAIWALGLRNPYTFDLQPKTGRIMVNEVGSQYWEEVNEIVKGGNYGWPGIEGKRIGENPPAGYRDPTFTYSHKEGCAVIGSAFYNPPVPGFPQKYVGKYFFADYCMGFIKVMNPDNGVIEEVFLKGANRPVSIRSGPDGNLYFLARGGLGGGSDADNTSSNNGALWRIEYRGDGSPVVSIQPKPIQIPIGDDATFVVQASGAPQLKYQWFKNDQAINGATDVKLVYSTAKLTDNGAFFYCKITNAVGQVNSQSVVLNVTTNTRPTLNILSPDPSWKYRGGDTIFFNASAIDLEDGKLFADAFSWRVDFHHEDHDHPALDETFGIQKGFYVIPRLGETSENVLYRLTCTVKDKQGLVRTVVRDILPKKISFIVRTEPSGININVDGQRLKTPATVTSVEGIRRVITAPVSQINNPKLYGFNSWGNGQKEPIYTFLAGEQNDFLAKYDTKNLSIGNGSGLKGRYFQAVNTLALNDGSVYKNPIALSRVDTVIDFDWGFEFSPDITRLKIDLFAARWSGQILAPYTDEYTFYLASDDGVRLWINDKLIIDQWVNQAITEVNGKIKLEGGKRYNIKLEYYESGGQAAVKMSWSTPLFNKVIIPKLQLFPDPTPDDLSTRLDFAVRVYPSPAKDEMKLFIRSILNEKVQVRLFDTNGRLVYQQPIEVNIGLNQFQIPVSELPIGLYILSFTGGINNYEAIKVMKN
jgi:glucose/arabinose dehydrogenase